MDVLGVEVGGLAEDETLADGLGGQSRRLEHAAFIHGEFDEALGGIGDDLAGGDLEWDDAEEIRELGRGGDFASGIEQEKLRARGSRGRRIAHDDDGIRETDDDEGIPASIRGDGVECAGGALRSRCWDRQGPDGCTGGCSLERQGSSDSSEGGKQREARRGSHSTARVTLHRPQNQSKTGAARTRGRRVAMPFSSRLSGSLRRPSRHGRF